VFALPVVNRRLRLTMVMVVLFVLGQFGAYTFVRPFLEGESSAGSGFITALLMVYGVGGAAGNFLGGHLVARNARAGFMIGAAGVTAALLVLLAVGRWPVGQVTALLLWGIAFGVAQLSQVNLTQAAAPDTFEAAMSLNTTAYNTSIALGALIGGLCADYAGIHSVMYLGIVLTLASSLVTVFAGQRDR
jgi:predicted MFS family arabinose efflux permease